MQLRIFDNSELEFYISIIDSYLDYYTDKVNMLENLKDEFLIEIKNREG